MVSSVGSTQPQQFVSALPKHSPPPAPHSESSQDSVQLSPAAQKALSGDVDHDGDSH
jgi:hypothetical protein